VIRYLSSLGAKIVDSIAYFKNLVTDTLTIGSREKPTGITLYDEVTGEPYCLSIANGDTKTRAGACDTLPEERAPRNTPPPSPPPASEPPSNNETANNDTPTPEPEQSTDAPASLAPEGRENPEEPAVAEEPTPTEPEIEEVSPAEETPAPIEAAPEPPANNAPVIDNAPSTE